MTNLLFQKNELRRIPLVLIAVLTISLLLSGYALKGESLQDSATTGAEVWIEFPTQGSNLTNQEITFVVYATSASGVSGIELKLNGEPMPAGQLTTLSSDGSSLMVRLDQTWQPPDEGEYTLEASAAGASALVTFCVGTCEELVVEEEGPTATDTDTPAPDDPTGTATASPTPANTSTYTPTVQPTETYTPTTQPTATYTPSPEPSNTPTPYTESSADFWVAPDYINQGECTTINWNVYGDFQAIYLEGSSVNASGADSECPSESYTYHLQVVEMDGSNTDYWASVEVYVPPADSSGPTFNYVTHFWEGCTIYGEAGITDPSGVTWAEFWFNHNEQGWAWIQMNQNGEQWVSQVGIDTDGFAGSLVYKVRTLDSLNNESWSGEYVHNYAYCGE